MFDMMKMMGKVKELQDKMQAAQSELNEITAQGEAGAGMVKAVVNGNKQVIHLEIDPSLDAEKDMDILKDLIIGAVNNGIKEAETKAKEHLEKSTEGLIPNIPGFDFNNMI